jgi:hypothetical protein
LTVALVAGALASDGKPGDSFQRDAQPKRPRTRACFGGVSIVPLPTAADL